jgi:hypothetical protein
MATAAPTVAVPRHLDTAQTEFGGLLRLEAARLLTPVVHPGDDLRLELVWRSLRATQRELQVVARLVDAARQTRARRDVRIDGSTTSARAPERDAEGTMTMDLPLPASIEPGRYQLALAVTDLTNGVEVPISAEDGLPPVLIESQQILGAVRVAPLTE